MAIRPEKRMLTEQLESLKNENLRIKIDRQREANNRERIGLQRDRIATQIEMQNLQTDMVNLQVAQVGTRTAEVSLGKASDKFKYEQADRFVSQQEYRMKLELKHISVADLANEIKHQRVLSGATSPMFNTGMKNANYQEVNRDG